MEKKYAGLGALQTFLDNLRNTFSLSSHNHDSSYDSKGSADLALDSAKSYTDSAVLNLASITTVDTKIGTHNTSASAHGDIRELISNLTTKLNTFIDVDDTTVDQLSEVLTLIENNKGTLESLTTSKVNVSDIVNNLTTDSTSKVLSAAQGVAIRALIDALQAALDEMDTEIDAKVDKTGDVMEGALVAQNNADYTVKQMRNIILVADGDDIPAGSNGDICLVYTP